jgi:hypothetical protein
VAARRHRDYCLQDRASSGSSWQIIVSPDGVGQSPRELELIAQPLLHGHCAGTASGLPVPAARQEVPPSAASLEQAVRARHSAGHSQRAIARDLSVDRRKVKQIIDRGHTV